MRRLGDSFRLTILLLLVLGASASLVSAQSRGRSARFQDFSVGDETAIQQQLQSTSASMAPSAALAGPVDPDLYLLGPGDVLSLEYTGPATLTKGIVVDGEGRIQVPNLGTILVAGRSLTEVREEIVGGLKPYIPGAKIDFRLLNPRIFKVYVVGAVNEAGIAEVRGSARVIEALQAVGGLAENASTRNIRVMRSGDEQIIADLESFLWTGDLNDNPYLHDGDRIVVPTLTQRVLIAGAVARPASYEYRAGDMLTDVIQVAGGLLSEARRDSILIVRFGPESRLDTLTVDLSESDTDAKPTPILEDDRIFVRSQVRWHPAQNVSIRGEIHYPGTYAIVEGQSRISDLIAWCGGFSPKAARQSVRLLRRPEIDGEDVEFDRLSRLTRAEMTDTEYQTFRGKLAIRQSAYLIDFTTGVPHPADTDVFLHHGDIIEVERLQASVRVDGNVFRPGFIAYEPSLTVDDYLNRAGGTTPRADTGKLRITRAGSNESQRAKGNWEVGDGDFIWIPEKKDTSFWDTFKDVIAVAGQTAAVLLLLDTITNN